MSPSGSHLRLARRRLHRAAANGTRITTLPNKIRVVTESSPGYFASVGVYLDAGSRYETPSTLGSSHFLERIAFKSTATMSSDRVSSLINSFAGQFQASASREAMAYQASHFSSASSSALSLIADTILNPSITADELQAIREASLYEIREMQSKPEMILPEVLHQVAYGNSCLGNPLICPEDRIAQVSAATLRSYMERWYRPERMVVAGAGLPHEELVDLVQRLFASLNSLGSSESKPLPPLTSAGMTKTSVGLHSPSKSNARSASHLADPKLTLHGSSYQGGWRDIRDTASELSHVYLAFEGLPIGDPDIYALAVIQFLLGGGGSFSAGGPGKGMYSRLYTRVLNHYAEIDHCAAFHHIYTDSSLFGIFASYFSSENQRFGRNATPKRILSIILQQLGLLLHSPVLEEELGRAKNQLKSNLMIAVESRPVEVEDLGRQILAHNRRIPMVEMCERIDEVTVDDVHRVAHRVFGDKCLKPPTLVVQGPQDASDLPTFIREYGLSGGVKALH